MEFVPVLDFFFAEFPAEVDVAALVSADEVDEASLKVLQFTAHGRKFVNEFAEAAFVGVEPFGERLAIAGMSGVFELFVERRGGLVRADDVFDDSPDQRETLVGLRQGKPAFGTGG